MDPAIRIVLWYPKTYPDSSLGVVGLANTATYSILILHFSRHFLVSGFAVLTEQYHCVILL